MEEEAELPKVRGFFDQVLICFFFGFDRGKHRKNQLQTKRRRKAEGNIGIMNYGELLSENFLQHQDQLDVCFPNSSFYRFFFSCLTGGVEFKGIFFPSMVCSAPTNESDIDNITDDYHTCYSLLEMQICDDHSRVCDKCNLSIRGPWGCFAGFQKFGKFSHSEGKFQQNNPHILFMHSRTFMEDRLLFTLCFIKFSFEN